MRWGLGVSSVVSEDGEELGLKAEEEFMRDVCGGVVGGE